MRTAAAYIRVSTEMQTEYSPDSQLKLIKDYASRNELILSEIYSDEGISGRTADKRPGFKRMIADAKRKKFDAILIYNTSRFARNHEESIVYRNMLQREGIEVISITQPSVDYKTDILMNALYAVMDERYSIELSENVKRGMREKTSRGIYISCAPLGYTRAESNKPLVIDENESSIIRWIFNEYSVGKSMYSIARELNAKGYKTKRGKPFDRRGIHRILSNPVYKGYLSWTCDSETIYMEADHKPIINAIQFEKVQSMLKENERKKVYKLRDSAVCSHWLTGLIRCPDCSTTYIYVKGYGGRSDRFRCGNYNNASCNNKHSIKASVLESLVLEYLENTYFTDIKFSKERLTDSPLDNNAHHALTQLEKAMERAKQAYLQGIDTIKEYKKNKNSIAKEMVAVKEQLSFKTPPVTDGHTAEVKTMNLIDMLKTATDNKTKNQLVRSIISKIVIGAENNNLDFYFFE